MMGSGTKPMPVSFSFHKIPDFPYETSPAHIIENFKNRLNNQGLMTTVRASRGEDILAACGMLAGEHNK